MLPMDSGMMCSTEHDPVELALQKMQFIFLIEIAQEWEGGFSDLYRSALALSSLLTAGS